LWQSIRVEAAAFDDTPAAACDIEIRASAAGMIDVVDKFVGRRSCLLRQKISGIWLLTLVVALHTTTRIEAGVRIVGLLVHVTHLYRSLWIARREARVSVLRSRVSRLNLLWNEFIEG